MKTKCYVLCLLALGLLLSACGAQQAQQGYPQQPYGQYPNQGYPPQGQYPQGYQQPYQGQPQQGYGQVPYPQGDPRLGRPVQSPLSQQVSGRPGFSQYTVIGDPRRANKVAEYLTRHGKPAQVQAAPEVIGWMGKKRIEGVTVTSNPADPNSGVFIPVSDAALQKGLCSDQQALLDGLPAPGPTVCPGGNCTPALGGPATTQWNALVDVVNRPDQHKPAGSAASKIEVFENGPRVQVVNYNGQATQRALDEATQRALTELVPIVNRPEFSFRNGGKRTCLWVLHNPY